jgi:hypothetical protein
MDCFSLKTASPSSNLCLIHTNQNIIYIHYKGEQIK